MSSWMLERLLEDSLFRELQVSTEEATLADELFWWPELLALAPVPEMAGAAIENSSGELCEEPLFVFSAHEETRWLKDVA